ncbi:hypothetical protein [Mesorhizobium sp.]|uniref:hypothetical protein n=1 Tax=Mesorhizobium sp. TaxID=1871066 RepID=UPI0025F6EB6D|nr:hypothetical protein [Mesorhizobium sp.]
MKQTPKVLLSADGKRRVVFYENDNGLFQWREQGFIPPDPDLGHPDPEWGPTNHIPSGYFARLDVAEGEARKIVGWPGDADTIGKPVEYAHVATYYLRALQDLDPGAGKGEKNYQSCPALWPTEPMAVNTTNAAA